MSEKGVFQKIYNFIINYFIKIFYYFFNFIVNFNINVKYKKIFYLFYILKIFNLGKL